MGGCFGKEADPEAQALCEAKRKADANKILVRRFFEEVLIAKNIEPMNQYISPKKYIQHNPMIGDGIDAARAAFQDWFKMPGGFTLEIKNIGAEGDLVFIHSKYTAGGTVTAVADLFRVTDNHITEHWDVMQEVPKDAVNPHPMF